MVSPDLGVEEVDEVRRHLPELIVDRGDDSSVVGNVALDYRDDLRRVALNVGRSDAVADLFYRYRLGVRRTRGGIDVMHTLDAGRNVGVYLDYDLVGALGVDVGSSDRGRRDDVAVLVNCCGFDYRDVDRL